ncbi:hypothetical protein [Streptomyces sp. NPDC001222]|uniref:hypothetical protein n=1 Tax=Streptomyces sp. NPDC001222 TaxID=3364548 RepID=UPI003689D17A
MQPDFDARRRHGRFEVPPSDPRTGGQIATDAFLFAALVDHLRFGVTEQDANLPAGHSLLRQLVFPPGYDPNDGPEYPGQGA